MGRLYGRLISDEDHIGVALDGDTEAVAKIKCGDKRVVVKATVVYPEDRENPAVVIDVPEDIPVTFRRNVGEIF